jgi:transposase-like protein
MDLVGPGGLLSELTKQVLETGLEVEMEEHLGYAKHAVEGRNHGNSRNGTRSKTVITEIGPVDIDVPRDRDGSFEPATVRKNQRRLDGVDSMVISLTAKGLTTGEVEAHLAEVYSTNISRETISKITDRVLDELADWQNRPLDRGQFQSVVANHGVCVVVVNRARACSGVRSSSTSRGRWFSSRATRSRSSAECRARSVCLGK